MMDSMRSAIFLAAFAVMGCTAYDNGEQSGGRAFRFAIVYMSIAWGEVRQGVYIDADGRVYSYNIQGCTEHEDHPWIGIFPTSGPYGEYELANYFHHRAVFLKQVSAEDLEHYTDIAKHIANSPLTEPKAHGADMGSVNYVAYLWDESISAYRTVNIYVTGDARQSNLGEGAEELKQWLIEITDGQFNP